MTFSIAARCPDTGEFGVAVTTVWFAVGSICYLVLPGIGAVASQGVPNPALRNRCLDGLASGLSPIEALAEALSTDPLSEHRQVGLLDALGRTAAHTGAHCEDTSGHINEQDYVIAGNILTNDGVLRAIESSLLSPTGPGLPLAERMLDALDAGQAAGGDRRGRQSAAMFVGSHNPILHVDLRIDDSPDPLVELRRLLNLFREKYEPVYQLL